jgi:hypothetical protein
VQIIGIGQEIADIGVGVPTEAGTVLLEIVNSCHTELSVFQA